MACSRVHCSLKVVDKFWYSFYVDEFNAHTYKDKKGNFNTEDEDFLLRLLTSHPAPNELLDIGCGDGELTKKIKSTLVDTLITAIDSSQEQILLAKEHPLSGVEFICRDIQSFSTTKKFDSAYSFYAFPHMPKSQILPALQKVRELLEANSLFYLFTNIALFDTRSIPEEDQEACDVVFLNDWPSQINLVSIEEMEKLVAESGFSIVSNSQRDTGAKVKEYGEMISWQFTLT